MRARFLVVAFFALGLLAAAFFATTALEGDRPPEIDPEVETRAADAGPDLPPEPSTPFAGGAQGRVEPTAGGIRAAREGEDRLVEVRGRLVLRGGGTPPSDAVLMVRTTDEETDYPETVAALGGLEGVAELRRTQDLEERLDAMGGWKPRFRTRAEGDGTFSIRLPADHPKFRIEVESETAHYPGFEWFDLASPSVARGLVLTLEPAGSVVGTLRRGGGEPVAGGSIALQVLRGLPTSRAGDRPVASDAQGRFSLGGIPPGPYEIAAIAPGCAPASRQDLEIRAGEETRIDLVLADECIATGVVVDGSGAPVAGAAVRAQATERQSWGASSRLRYGRARTAADGSFRIGSLEPGMHKISARQSGYLVPKPEEAHLLPRGRVEGLRLVLEEGRSVSGRVLDAEGRPVDAATVTGHVDLRSLRRLTPRADPRWSLQRARSAADGTFRLTGLEDGPLLLRATLEGRGSARKEGVEAGPEEVELVLSGVSSVSGRVVEADTGRPVTRFTVRAVDGEADPLNALGYVETSGRRPEGRTFATGEGSFAIDGLAPGLLDLHVTAEGFLPEDLEGIELQADEPPRVLEIRLRPGAAIRGSVLDRVAWTPVAEAIVEAVAPGAAPDSQVLFLESPLPIGRTSASAKTDAEGRFEVTGAIPGTVRLRARHREFLPATGDPIEVRPREVVDGIVLTLPRGGDVDGFALHPDGTPFAGANARAIPVLGLRGVARTAEVDGTGYFLLERVPPGEVRVEVSRPARGGESDPRRYRGVVEVEEGKVARVELLAPSQGESTVRGRVRRGEAGVAGATVNVQPGPPAGGPEPAAFRAQRLSARTGEDGAYEIRAVPAGRATITVRAGKEGSRTGTSLTREVEIPEAQELVVDLDLPSASIRGVVTRGADGKPCENAQVRLQPFGPADPVSWTAAPASARVDDRGCYGFADGPPGRYRVTASEAMGFVGWGGAMESADALAPAAAAPVEVVGGEETIVDLALDRGGVAVMTVVGPEEKPVRGVWVRLEVEAADPDAGKWLPDRSAVTDRRGVATLSGIPPGRFRAVVSQSDWPRTESEEGIVRAGEETAFRIALERGTVVAVRVLGEEDRAVPRAQVEFLDASGRAHAGETRSWGSETASGTRHVAPVRPGTYTLRVRVDGYREESVPLQVGSESPMDVVVRVVREEKKGPS